MIWGIGYGVCGKKGIEHMGKFQKANLEVQNSYCSTALLLFCSIGMQYALFL